jgi:hypothetical protein
VPACVQGFEELVPEMDASMIEGNGDLHVADRTRSRRMIEP